MKNPTPIEAVATLRKFALNAPTEVGVAIAVILDHLANTEMVVSLIRSGFESAFRHAPEAAIIDAGKKRI